MQITYFPERACKLSGFKHCSVGRYCRFAKIRGYLSPWCRVCTRALFISKGNYGYGEPRNVILGSVQNLYFPVRACKLSGFKHRSVGRYCKFAEIRGYLSPWCRVCTRALFISKGSYGYGEPKNVILGSVQNLYFPVRACTQSGFKHRSIGRYCKFAEIRGYLSPWYRVCTRALFISKRSYGYGEPKNVILGSVQKP